MSDPLDGYHSGEFTTGGRTRPVHRTGQGPAVIVVSEIPGITPLVAEFGRRVAGIGCTAVLPSLFGTPGRPPSMGYALRSLGSACISREFAILAAGRTSPITSWLRALAAQAHAECGGPGVGVVGMCLTGNLALAMAVDDVVLAPVMSQPSLPFPIGAARRGDPGVSPTDLATVRRRGDDGLCVLGLRFTGDPFVSADRFASLRAQLGDAFVAIEIDSSPGNPYGYPDKAHSVLTEHYLHEEGSPTRAALDRVLDLFRRTLLTAS